MKVGILTLRFHSNFGFIMQAYAMQQIVRKLGHEPYTYYTKVTEEKVINKFKHIIKNILLKLTGAYSGSIFPKWLNNSDYDIINLYTNRFILENFSLTPCFKTIRELNQYDHTRFGAFIVGSDQVWREEFSLNIPTYYLDFVKHDAKKIAYAASFGVSKIDYTKEQIRICKSLIRKFSFVSVRETEGIGICKEVFDVDAVQVLDPTMLIESANYSQLADKSTKDYPEHYLCTYILDEDDNKMKAVKKIANDLHLSIINILEHDKSIIKPYPSINDILKCFKGADYVVTDSFHASVFSIIFNRQFCVLKNPYRGISRLTTLLRTFNLSERIVNQQIPYFKIDYKCVNEILESKRIESISFLSNALNEQLAKSI